MEILLPSPRLSDLFHGAIREALANAHSVAMIGQQDTRAWDHLDCYLVDNNEGDVGVIRCLRDACVGVVSNHDPMRIFDHGVAISAAPVELQAPLLSLCDFSLLELGGHLRVTAVFWSDGGNLGGPEPWHKIYLYGGELFRRELLDDEAWKTEADEHYDLTTAVATTILQIANRSCPQNQTMLTMEEFKILFPKTSEYRNEAIEQILSGERFRIA